MFKDKNENFRLKIAFEGTLTELVALNFARRLIEVGHDVWIMTARMPTQPYELYEQACEEYGLAPEPENTRNADIKQNAAELGIPNKIIFTNLIEKESVLFPRKI
ncbi:MAG: hypothetical protein LBS50_03370 [Prevotellaceae bacterium]|jgi:hypothetical protein|nr:hypothetical protein [Prevotellaceae bacterium]